MDKYEGERGRKSGSVEDPVPDTVEDLEKFITEMKRQIGAMELKRKMNPSGPDLGEKDGDVDLDQFTPERRAKPRTEGVLAVHLAVAEAKLRALRGNS